ncbi:MAG: hypothetical protein DCF20_13405 [Pseudanabaena sp.]|nr:MAG: hypothetical protein DCF20_13405 [Pseudanabaena sp.]
MKRYKLVILILIIVGGGLAVGSGYLQKHLPITALWDNPITALWHNFRPKGEQSISIQALEPKRADKLFTTFVYMPIIDYKKEDDNTTIKGVCSRHYTVDIGYDDTLKLFNQYHEAACKNDFQSMPNPTIIASDFDFIERQGDYSQKECDSFDEKKNTSIKQKSRIELLAKLGEDGQWDKIANKSKKALTGYLRLYCSESKVNK